MPAKEQSPRRVYGGRSAADRRAERRGRLLEAGLELFGTEGYAASSIEKLCAAASVSTRNFYEEFSSREALLMAIHNQVIESAVGEVSTAFAETDDQPVTVRIERAVRAYITRTAADPRRAKLSYVEIIGVSPAVEAHRLAWRARWVQMLVSEAKRAVARGEAEEREFGLGAVALIGAVNELVFHWSTDGYQTPLDDVIAEVIRMAKAVIIPPGTAAAPD
ncbi:TetR/AcrR family transcriptional regulator [Amycolatopsis magusensis]|uniref:AcrR family transcriptional regulator n=1 Tax=Amycolatopsis magusensis TaxID=882444 RepID=A0ABS4PUY9_9PSEU|nr:TetR/AcrR family transcriptional regulator [Amycolatopsis magusensis]MBP2182396.1 AcrR family transcriptional regulator [Amycolatopsis magusensis]MDI5977252.1 TetR/AcrR family transcriptional regulator [Amycolatopsis magusensis]